MKIKKESILNIVRQHREPPLQFRELMHLFGIDKGRRASFKAIIDRLIDQGDLVKLRGNRISLPSAEASGIVGRLSVNRSGYGFVSPEKGGEDIFIAARNLRENLHGDRVEVRVTAVKPGGRREGTVVRTIERALKRIVGRYEGDSRRGRFIPDDPRVTHTIAISSGGIAGASNGQVVVAELTAFPVGGRPAEGRIVEVLGSLDDPEVEVLSIIRKYDLPHHFPPDVLATARSLPSAISPADLTGRVDLREHLTVTIDGETAKDFDDAVSVSREGNNIRLWVSIADVSHYVKEDSSLDLEALQRGTSVYFPDRCIPMLPEELSNVICSLNPLVERLTVTAELLYDRLGNLKERKFYSSVIKSRARLTYTEVRKILVDKDQEVISAREELVADLRLMEELALRLMEMRRRRGSIDFDLPEPHIVLDLQGGTLAIVRAERNVAHRIIEEFMLAANEAVADFVEKKKNPFMYRIHEHPDLVKLRDFQEFVKNFGYEFRLEDERVPSGEFQRLLDAVEGKPEERLINEVLLRCMKQARYASENVGHFGLAAPTYTHFTSPIRRYPDLVVHRILKGIIGNNMTEPRKKRLQEVLPTVAEQSSRRERVAMEAERDVIDLKKVQFMVDKVGEDYDGFITGVSPSGLFVELSDLFVEGMVRVGALPYDFYFYHEKQHLLMGEGTRQVFRLGDRIRVRVGNVNVARREIDFLLAGAHQTGFALPLPEEYPHLPVKGKSLRGLSKSVSPRNQGGDNHLRKRGGKSGRGGGRGKR